MTRTFINVFGKNWINLILNGYISELISTQQSFEADPTRTDDPESGAAALRVSVTRLLDIILGHKDQCPK